MLRVETHCHTYISGDCLMKPQKIVAICQARGIDRLCVTDHNSMRGIQELQALAGELIIPGEEIMTTQGELLGYFMKEEIPAGLHPLAAIERLRIQGAVISVSHPFDSHRKGHWQMKDLLAILPLVDAIEVFNARCVQNKHNRQAMELAQKQGIAATVGSDAHSYGEIGQAVLEMPDFSTPQEFAQHLRQATPHSRLSPFRVHALSRWAVLAKKIRRRY
jgi:predicted metal-dependent phosphoesterase TrpH